MNITLDTNCIITLEENRPDARYIRCIVHGATEQKLRLRVVAISASERQLDGQYSESFRDFQAKVVGVGLEDVDVLLPPCVLDVTYWDYCIWGTEEFTEEEKRIHEILFPTSPFEYGDYCSHFGLDPIASNIDRKWRNRMIDTLALWTHIHNGGGTFITSDENFHRQSKKALLVRLGAGEILRPNEAAAKFCQLYGNNLLD